MLRVWSPPVVVVRRRRQRQVCVLMCVLRVLLALRALLCTLPLRLLLGFPLRRGAFSPAAPHPPTLRRRHCVLLLPLLFLRQRCCSPAASTTLPACVGGSSTCLPRHRLARTSSRSPRRRQRPVRLAGRPPPPRQAACFLHRRDPHRFVPIVYRQTLHERRRSHQTNADACATRGRAPERARR